MAYAVNQWKTELHDRVIPGYMADVRSYRLIHGADATDYDMENWEKINDLRRAIAKDSLSSRGLFTRVKEALDSGDYQTASDLQVELQEKMSLLRDLYRRYRKNLF